MWHDAQASAGSAVAAVVRDGGMLSAAWHCEQTPSPGARSLRRRLATVAAGDAGREHPALLDEP
jgi:hypothetical protein